MLITRETDYALRVLRALLDGEQHTVGEMADRELIPRQFGYKIVKKLARAGLVRVTRGAEGGCRLGENLAGASLYDLMTAMEESSGLSACMDPAYPCPWRERNGGCTVHCQLLAIQRNLDAELQSHSLLEILTGES